LQAPVKLVKKDRNELGHGLFNVTLVRESGNITITRTVGEKAVIIQPGQPDREITLPSRTLRECLAEDLRRLDADHMFGQVLKFGFNGSGK
jgi:hypothetical protein